MSRKLDGRLSHREREGLRRHLETCAACRELRARMESDDLDLRRVVRFSKPDRDSFVVRTMAQILEREEPHGEGRAPRGGGRALARLWTWQSAALAASIAVLAWFLLVRAPDLRREIGELREDLATAAASLESRDAEARVERADATPPTSLDGADRDPPSPQANDRSLATSGETEISRDESESPDSETPVVTLAQLDPPSAQELVEELLAALADDDPDEFERIATTLLALQQQTERVAHLLMESFEYEGDIAKRMQILGLMSHFSVDGQQDFYMEQLTDSTSVPLRRVLMAGMARVLGDGQASVPGATETLRRILADPLEDHEVRSFAARALLGESINRGTADFFNDIRVAVETSDDPRFRNQVVRALASHVGVQAGGLDLQVSDFLVEFLSGETDYDATDSVVDGLHDAADRESAITMIARIRRRLPESQELRDRLRLAQEVLASDRDESVQER